MISYVVALAVLGGAYAGIAYRLRSKMVAYDGNLGGVGISAMI